MRVFVYRNLRKKCWSIRALEGPMKGRVVAHADFVVLDDAKFKVSEAGRQRVLKTKQKNVHAGVVGALAGMNGHKTEAGRQCGSYLGDDIYGASYPSTPYLIGYNPYLSPTFHIKLQEGVEGHTHWHKMDLRCRAVDRADTVVLGYKGRVWSSTPTTTQNKEYAA